MNLRKHISCREANQLDLVDYFRRVGHLPKKIQQNNYWFLSPLRTENTASFKVGRKLNLWYDHGTGKGGTVIDFAIEYYNCSVSDLLQRLSAPHHATLVVQASRSLPLPNDKGFEPFKNPIKIIKAAPISQPALNAYLEERKIPLSIENKYCCQVEFELYQKNHLAIGFKNESGGYELRSPNFKGSSSPKEPIIFSQAGAKTVAVFEGFFSFLSYQTLLAATPSKKSDLPNQQTDFLILNSLSFFEKQRDTMEQYKNIRLYLDRDKAGIAATQKALRWSKQYKDASVAYKFHKDLNEFLTNAKNPRPKQSQGKSYTI